jgi:hypothetical protein
VSVVVAPTAFRHGSDDESTFTSAAQQLPTPLPVRAKCSLDEQKCTATTTKMPMDEQRPLADGSSPQGICRERERERDKPMLLETELAEYFYGLGATSVNVKHSEANNLLNKRLKEK